MIQNPGDGIGKCSVSIFKFSPNEKNTLVKIRFNVLSGYNDKGLHISFASPNRKTTLFDDDFNQINSIFIPATTGDINGDSKIDLTDAILALKILAEVKSANIELGADVDGDEKIGLHEAVYILQNVAEIKR